VIIPLVAIATPKLYLTDPIGVFYLDFEMNLNVVKQCVKYGKRVVFPSTSEVYGASPDREFKEDETFLQTFGNNASVFIEMAQLQKARIDALEQSRKELEQVSKAKSRALDHLSHELLSRLVRVSPLRGARPVAPTHGARFEHIHGDEHVILRRYVFERYRKGKWMLLLSEFFLLVFCHFSLLLVSVQ
jgi:hypothetical protein